VCVLIFMNMYISTNWNLGSESFIWKNACVDGSNTGEDVRAVPSRAPAKQFPIISGLMSLEAARRQARVGRFSCAKSNANACRRRPPTSWHRVFFYSFSLSLSLSLFFLHFSLLLKFRTNSVLFRSCKLSLVSLSELIKPRRRLFVLYELSRFSFFFFLQM